MPSMPTIGSLNEKHLHRSLKEWYAEPDDRLEVVVEGFVIDIVRGDLLVEVQTKNVSAIKSKLATLARGHRIRLVHPIALEKWIVKPPDSRTGRGRTTRRKSPKRGRIEDVFDELVSVAPLLTDPNFSVEVLFIREEEARRHEARGRWRRRGWATEERRLVEVVDRRLFERPSDWRTLLPEGLEDPSPQKAWRESRASAGAWRRR